ncbi:hypothetical protein QSJ10_15465 (plasmid) [Geobacillus stearothermophilus ATCC 12980]|uniref:hypothetical protein n=1 Tax=Geobacillus stearothermophilus TaxID=1422 RepID=UPI0009BC2D8C|nr:hypothetical protein [Geobacillus stearothermophilus]WJM14261.1 hypothetical protein QSJ10_15465 [Geobacillus stearothermophilus ATCC 12980]
MKNFRDYQRVAAKYITFIESEFYPDYLDNARFLYGEVLNKFYELVNSSSSSIELLENISKTKDPVRTQLLRIFRKYVSPDTSVEMLKRKQRIPDIIKEFGTRFRDIKIVRQKIATRNHPDETIMALLYEYKDRGKKGYELTDAFFTWFEQKFPNYEIIGPRGAGKDILLNEVLPGFPSKIPADFLIYRRSDKTPIVVGFARYDSDRGGAQEDDRTGGNRDKITEIKKYAAEHNIPLKILFLNDGPGLLLGSMWNDYSALEDYGEGCVMVCTLKMLEERFTIDWLENL